MANADDLNPIEKRIWRHWRLLHSKILEQEGLELTQAIRESKEKISQGYMSGHYYNLPISLQQDYCDRVSQAFIEKADELLERYQVNPTECLRELIEKEVLDIYDPDINFAKAVKNMIPRAATDIKSNEQRVKDEFRLRANGANGALQILWLEQDLKMPIKLMVFISSWQKEFEEYRALLRFFIEHDPVLGRFYNVFVFEHRTPISQGPEDAYVTAAKACDIYIGLFGTELREAVSKEYEVAKDKEVHLYQDSRKEPSKELEQFKEKVGRNQSWHTYPGFDALWGQVREKLMEFLEKREKERMGS